MKHPFTTETSMDFKSSELILYSRSDHDGYRWWNTWFTGKKDHPEKELIGKEAEEITFFFHEKLSNGVEDIMKCLEEGSIASIGENEGNLFYEGDYANYWIRFIARKRDYNMYVKAFEKMPSTTIL